MILNSVVFRFAAVALGVCCPLPLSVSTSFRLRFARLVPPTSELPPMSCPPSAGELQSLGNQPLGAIAEDRVSSASRNDTGHRAPQTDGGSVKPPVVLVFDDACRKHEVVLGSNA
jgi:hypothetical protein